MLGAAMLDLKIDFQAFWVGSLTLRSILGDFFPTGELEFVIFDYKWNTPLTYSELFGFQYGDPQAAIAWSYKFLRFEAAIFEFRLLFECTS